ncbi:pyocin activator protein PrtN [Pseudomonas sp. URMO17WK12:I1]|uniref:pyocin activator PrtN family protein n=1 Tax=unclassified Pseudomonas TaxID=196821 RepID=UPI0004811CCE|nr:MULTISPECIES: pyocin activator PrtN family protein [unclassified Pseudomonas]PZW65236.1 pyocin activator protein PrtN [Pseudomonas sp. URMO17WK12:I1]
MSQQELRLPPAPRAQTVELLYRTFGDVLAPADQVRTRYFANLNPENFTRAMNSGRLSLPVVALDSSAKAPKFIDIRHLAIFIDSQSDAADNALAGQSQQQP